jgi:hypothetical protein
MFTDLYKPKEGKGALPKFIIDNKELFVKDTLTNLSQNV